MGSRGFLRGGLLLCTALALLVASACANAKSRFEVTPASHTAELALKGTHGYEISFLERNRSSLQVDVSRPGGSFLFAPLVAADYRIHEPRVRADEIAGTLPGLGRIAVRFHPVGGPRREAGFSIPGCRGGAIVKQRGYFKGTIRFRGERGYTAAHATRARGEAITHEKEICKRSPNERSLPQRLIAARLQAFSKGRGRRVGFSVSTLKSAPANSRDSALVSGIVERRHGMKISRYVIAFGRHVLTLGDSGEYPTSATVLPPEPFRGSAVFERGSLGQNSWTGTLSVPLPGAGLVPLTGANFSASLCQKGGCTFSEPRRRAVQIIS
jgi:hypothetical protein